MANKTNCIKNGKAYYPITKDVGHKIKKAGNEIPVRREFYGDNKKDAEKKYQAYIEKQNRGLESKKQYFGIMADNWIYEFLVNDPKLKERTKDLYIKRWNKYIKPSTIYHLPIENITAGVLQRFYNDLECPPSALATINKVMSRFYNYLVNEGFVTHNITASMSLKKDKKEAEKDIIIWNDDELETILSSFDKAQNNFRLRFLIILAINTGCRVSELLGLKYNDIEESNLKICRQVSEMPKFKRGEKTIYELGIDTLKSESSYRVIPLNNIVLRELELHRRWQRKDMLKNGYRTDYLFTTNNGSLYYRRNITTACNRYYKRIGVEPKGFHTYRHTFGSIICRKGTEIQTAAALLGHSDINVTAKYYINVSLPEKREAVNSLSDIMKF